MSGYSWSFLIYGALILSLVWRVRRLEQRVFKKETEQKE